MQRENSHHLVISIAILLAFGLGACLPAVEHNPEPSIMMTATATLLPTDTASPATAVPVKKTATASVIPFAPVIATRTMTPRLAPSATATFTMPAYYKPHSALTPLNAAYEADFWQQTSETTSFTPTTILHSRFAQGNKPELRDVIFDGNNIVIIPQAQELSSTLVFTHTIWGGSVLQPDKDIFDENEHGYAFGFHRVNSRFLVIYSHCYGGITIRGLHVVNKRKMQFYTITDSYGGNCEGASFPFGFSPDKQFLIYNTTIVTLMTGEQVHICAEDDFVRSFAWSQDERYVYVACGSQALSDQLYRYDTQTHEELLLTDRNRITFKAIQMNLAPDQTRIVFDWKDSNFVAREVYGAWMLDLTRLDE